MLGNLCHRVLILKALEPGTLFRFQCKMAQINSISVQKNSIGYLIEVAIFNLTKCKRRVNGRILRNCDQNRRNRGRKPYPSWHNQFDSIQGFAEWMPPMGRPNSRLLLKRVCLQIQKIGSIVSDGPTPHKVSTVLGFPLLFWRRKADHVKTSDEQTLVRSGGQIFQMPINRADHVAKSWANITLNAR
jgi:hypothetical protein